MYSDKTTLKSAKNDTNRHRRFKDISSQTKWPHFLPHHIRQNTDFPANKVINHIGLLIPAQRVRVKLA